MLKNQGVLGLAITVMMLVSAFSAYGGLIKDSYIITFKSESGIIDPPNESYRGLINPFGEERPKGQSKKKLAEALGLKENQIYSIFSTINAVHLKISAEVAYKFSLDERVLHVEQDRTVRLAQSNPGWGLDRLDEITPVLDNTYNLTSNDGTGRTIYMLDSGLALNNSAVAAEFSGRALAYELFENGNTIVNGEDCFGHGTQVASAIASNTYGVAKSANIVSVKITDGCGIESRISRSITAFNQLAEWVPAGTIVNWSNGIWNEDGSCYPGIINIALENAISACHNAGIIVVVAAFNDTCNTADFSPTRILQAFVVGGTSMDRIAGYGQDEIFYIPGQGGSRTGSNISGFAPGESILTMKKDGTATYANGTSMSTAYVSGLFAIACQAAGTFCDSAITAASLYQAMRDTGQVGTVTGVGGTVLPNGTPSRFLSNQW